MDTTELQNQAIEIRDAENEGENTALRVGTMLLAIIDAFANIVDLDTLQQILEQYASTTVNGQINWRHARCVFLASMGADFDAVNGDGWEYTDHNGDIVFNPTSKNLRVVGETGSYFVYTNVLYVHAHTCHTYKWDAAEQKMVEITDTNLPTVITYKNTPAFSQVAIGESYVFQSQQSSVPKIAIKISSSETYSFSPDPKKIYAFRDIRQAMLWKSSNQTWVSLTPRVINNLTTGGEGDALSAEMGKTLKALIDKMGIDIVTIDDADLAFIDEDGNVAMKVAEGHVETQNFDSRQVATNTTAIQQLQSQIGQQGSAQTDVVVKEDADAAFDIADESGRVALRITSKGHIKTKCFDSENMDIFRATKMDNPQCVCHGYGSVSSVQANTIAYFRAGYTAGYRFFECDALNCSDGVPVCTHDSNNGLTVYDKTTHEATNVSIASVNGTRTIQMSSTELVDGYTWDSAGNVPIALLSEVIWQVCYFYRCPLHVDGQGLNKVSRLAASQYAESLGVGQYVFHELQSGAYTDWAIPCNAIVSASSAADIQAKAASYKKADNNIIFYLAQGAAAATIKSLADAAHEAGCYLMSWTFTSAASAREWFANGANFIITSNSITNNKI